MNSNNDQKWFFAIVLGISMMFFITSIVLIVSPTNNTPLTPEKERAAQYTSCIKHAGNYFFGDSEELAINQCAQLFQQYNTKQ